MVSLGCVMHFFNEELLMPSWVKWHTQFYDSAILINHGSTDNSVEIARSLMPDTWKIVDSRLNNFNAIDNDNEVIFWETKLKTDFKFASNTTEFLFIPRLKQQLADRFTLSNHAWNIKTICLVDKEDNLPILDPIWKNRTYGFYDPSIRRDRYLHNADHGHYETGRHGTNLNKIPYHGNWYLLHMSYSPYPFCKERKLQIQTKIPQSDKDLKRGFEHIMTSEELDQKRQKMLEYSYDLMTFINFAGCYNYFNEQANSII